ncbi:TMIE protein, partial [Acromyrmex insinuator]
MEETTLSTFLSVSSSSPNEVSTKDMEEMEMVQWLENEALPGFRIWQLAGIVLSVLLSIVVGLCCCIRFRVPRTKQEIEADYIRKKITKSFRNELSKISNTEMDEMNLQKALDRIRNEHEKDTSAIAKECTEMERSAHQGFRSRFNAVFGGMRVRFNQREHTELVDATI